MSWLSSTELDRLNSAILSLHATERAEELPGALLKSLEVLVPADIRSVSLIGFMGMPFSHVIDPPGSISPAVEEALFRTLRENPTYGRRVQADCISNKLSRRQWHRTAHYAEGFRQLRQEDGIGLDLELEGGVTVGLNATRSLRGFREAEFLSLNLLAPHIQLAARKLKSQAEGMAGWALVDPEGLRLREPIAPTVQLLLKRWFGEQVAGTMLPGEVRDWLRTALRNSICQAAGLLSVPAPYHRAGPEGKLVLQLSPSPLKNGDPFLLLREMRIRAGTGEELTVREKEVLFWLSRDLSNAEIAKRIGAARGTVKRHLENLYAKLGVRNRFEAISRGQHLAP